MSAPVVPYVSIIMPVYNGERYIRMAIESILAQTWQDWELIVINDGSTDATAEILSQFADPRITMIYQDNQGEAAARNAGLAVAAGEYIAFLDADDLYLPNALADLVEYLDVHYEDDAVYSDGYFCDAHGDPLMRLSEHRMATPVGRILDAIVNSSSIIIAIHCTMTRHAIIERSGLQFDCNLVIGPDWDFWIHLAHHARFGYLDKTTCMYRVHQTNITQIAGNEKRHSDLIQGRLKILYSDWFQDLSVLTRQQFFYHLLVFLLSGNSIKQKEILQSHPFSQLPSAQRAALFRQIATDYLLKRDNVEFTRTCLEQALAVYPQDRNSRILLKLMDSNYHLCALSVTIRRSIRQIAVWLHALGKKTSKPAPLAFRSPLNTLTMRK